LAIKEDIVDTTTITAPPTRKILTVDEARQMPPVIDVPTAARFLGIGRTAAYELIRLGHWPTPVLRLGKLIRVPSGPLLDLVGVQR
jgi:predicted DNA-binding transcriptional regulator AlpA